MVAVHHDLATVPDYFDHVFLINRARIAEGPVADGLYPGPPAGQPMAGVWPRRRSTSWTWPRLTAMLLDALLLQLGYNATLVTIGATLLGHCRRRGRHLPVPAQTRAGVGRDQPMPPCRASRWPSSSWSRWAATGAACPGCWPGSAISAAVGLLLCQLDDPPHAAGRGRRHRRGPVGVLRLRHRPADGDPDHVAPGGRPGWRASCWAPPPACCAATRWSSPAAARCAGAGRSCCAAR